MALTTEQKQKAATALAQIIFNDGEITAHSDGDVCINVIQSIETAMTTVISTIPGGWQSKTILQAIVDNMPEPFQTASTAQQKADAFKIWADLKAGRII